MLFHGGKRNVNVLDILDTDARCLHVSPRSCLNERLQARSLMVHIYSNEEVDIGHKWASGHLGS